MRIGLLLKEPDSPDTYSLLLRLRVNNIDSPPPVLKLGISTPAGNNLEVQVGEAEILTSRSLPCLPREANIHSAATAGPPARQDWHGGVELS